MRYLLDTNHLSPLITLSHPLRQKVMLQIGKGDSFSICVPILTEFLFGISLIKQHRRNLQNWQRIRSEFPCIPLDEQDGEFAAKMQVQLRRQGWQLYIADALIAVTAIRYDLTLLTTDRDFDAVPNLRVENWIK